MLFEIGGEDSVGQPGSEEGRGRGASEYLRSDEPGGYAGEGYGCEKGSGFAVVEGYEDQGAEGYAGEGGFDGVAEGGVNSGAGQQCWRGVAAPSDQQIHGGAAGAHQSCFGIGGGSVDGADGGEEEKGGGGAGVEIRQFRFAREFANQRDCQQQSGEVNQLCGGTRSDSESGDEEHFHALRKDIVEAGSRGEAVEADVIGDQSKVVTGGVGLDFRCEGINEVEGGSEGEQSSKNKGHARQVDRFRYPSGKQDQKDRHADEHGPVSRLAREQQKYHGGQERSPGCETHSGRKRCACGDQIARGGNGDKGQSSSRDDG